MLAEKGKKIGQKPNKSIFLSIIGKALEKAAVNANIELRQMFDSNSMDFVYYALPFNN